MFPQFVDKNVTIFIFFDNFVMLTLFCSYSSNLILTFLFFILSFITLTSM